MPQNIILLLSGTKKPQGGLTSSTLLRATSLQRLGYSVTICTLDYRPDQDAYVEEMVSNDFVGSDVTIRNFYRDALSDVESLGQVSLAASLFSEDGEKVPYFKQYESSRLTRYFDSDGTMKYSDLAGEGNSNWRRYYDAQHRQTGLVETSMRGTLHRATTFDPLSGNITQRSYLAPSGIAYMTEWLKPADQSLEHLFVFSQSSKGSIRYWSMLEAQREWFMGVVGGVDGPTVVMVDDTSTVDVALSGLLNDVPTIAVIHNNHLREPFTSGSEINAEHVNMLNRMNEFDLCVCSTVRQKEDLETLGTHDTKVVAIPQAIDDLPFIIGKKSEGSFAVFGRLTDQKNLIGLVRCFSEVAKIRPLARLDIFGEGPLKDVLTGLIAELGLGQHVSLLGHVSDVRSEMTKYLATVVTSKFEGFGLVVGESLIAGVPVVAFDCNYGPSDMIINESNGFLIKQDDYDNLRDTLIEVFDNPGRMIEMGLRGRMKILESFSRNSVSDKWVEAIRSVF